MRRNAFTLVELLVVIGVIALLIGLLMPTLQTARQSAQKAQCASNMRQIATGIVAYAQDNRGSLPGAGGEPQQLWDWIYWIGIPPYDDFRSGAAAHYIGASPAVFRCPADDWAHHTAMVQSTRLPYQYSYQMNCFAPIDRYQCCTYGVPCKVMRIHRSSDKILLIDASEATLVDGAWVPPPQAGSSPDDLSDRHERGGGPSDDHRGNVAFLDTHVEFVTRHFAHDPAHFLP